MYNVISIFSIMLGVTFILGGHFFLILPSLLLVCFFLTAHMMMNGNLWMGLVLIIVYVGGMLILFSYFVTLSPSSPIKINWIITLVPLMVISWDPISGSDLVSDPSSIMNIMFLSLFVFSVSWLLYSMIIVVHITGTNGGTLRLWDGN